MADIKDEIRKHDNVRYFLLESLKGLLELINQTRSDNFVGGGKKGEGELLSGIDLREWNEEWLETAREIIRNIWKTGKFLSQDIAKVAEEVLSKKGE
ncbi:MAG TPA: hypothetical protein PKV21_10000 [bacterium]|nr:hypothetical protein [bacterium]